MIKQDILKQTKFLIRELLAILKLIPEEDYDNELGELIVKLTLQII